MRSSSGVALLAKFRLVRLITGLPPCIALEVCLAGSALGRSRMDAASSTCQPGSIPCILITTAAGGAVRNLTNSFAASGCFAV